MTTQIFRKEDTPIGIRLLSIISAMLIGTLAGTILWSAVWGETSTEALKWLQAIQSIFVFILPCLAYAWLFSKQPMHRLHLDKGFGAAAGVYVVLLFLTAIPLINLLSLWNEQLQLPAWLSGTEARMQAQENAARELTERFLQANTLWGLAGNLMIMAVLPALSEELFFRSTLQPLLSERMNPHAAVWCSAVLFSAIHLQWYGFVPRLLMGAALGYLLLWSRSVWLPILGHFVNNACMVATYYIATRQNADITWMETAGTGGTRWIALLSGAAVIGLLYALRRSLTINKASSRNSSGN